MSADSRHARSMAVHGKTLAVAVAAFLAVGVTSSAAVRAQDATPMASPVAAECDSPGLGPDAATPYPMASPMAMASPVAADAAVTPEPAPDGTPAEGSEADEIVAAADNLIACVNGGDYEGAVGLVTDHFVMTTFGAPSKAAAVEGITGTTFGNPSVANPQTYDDGSVSADVTYMETKNHLAGETWHFVEDGEYYKLDAITYFTPEVDEDTAVIAVTLSETKADDGSTTYAIEPSPAEFTNPGAVILHGFNNGTELHEIVVLKLPEGAKPEGILDGSIKESDVDYLGSIQLPPGEQGDLVLLNLDPGVYTLVCFVSGPDGAPHAAHGMISQITVDAPSS